MKFLRHFGAVVLLIAAVVAIALAVGGGAGQPPGGAGRRGNVELIAPGQGALPQSIVGGQGNRMVGPGLALSNAGDLVRKSVLEFAGIAVIAVVSSGYQRRRRAGRRRRATAASGDLAGVSVSPETAPRGR
jgi:hypothetical protein